MAPGKRTEPDFSCLCYGQTEIGEANDGVDDQHRSERRCRVTCETSRQQSRRRQGHDGDRQQHGPNSHQKAAHIRAGRELPDIRDERRDDDQRGTLCGRHQQAKQAHRHRRQPHAGHALDDAGKDENQR
jgi:hypothetical protein